jgi:hypothetical protein
MLCTCCKNDIFHSFVGEFTNLLSEFKVACNCPLLYILSIIRESFRSIKLQTKVF